MDYIVFSHLRWDFVFQRPQHILSRCAKECRVFFWEEPIRTGTGRVSLNIGQRENGLTVLVPELPTGMTEQQEWVAQSMLLSELIADQRISSFVAWYYNPMAMHFTDSLSPALTVYDCMDELSAFWGAPPGLTRAESKLFESADLVLTGGQSLYDSKRERHPSVCEEEEKVRLIRVDTFLARNSWDSTWKRMKQLVIDKTGQRPSSVNSGLDRNTTEQGCSWEAVVARVWDAFRHWP